MLILAIETSCDETSAAVVDGTRVLSNVVSSQVALHQRWGGIVPEAAARAHVEAILPVLEEALTGLMAATSAENASDPQSGSSQLVPRSSFLVCSLQTIQAIAVTNRPGLVGALSVGVTAAKAIAFARGLRLIGVHHLEGHLLSPFANGETVPLPHLALIASGGHTELVLVNEIGSYQIVGHTIDDAAGEAFDKAARLLGLGYPGGKAIQDAAEGGDPSHYSLPKGLSGDTTDFSFSGLKTAVLRLVEKEQTNLVLADAAASVQEAIASVLAERTISAAEKHCAKAVTLVGGVAANLRLRQLLAGECERAGIPFFTPSFDLCTDNAAMIGIAASFRLANGQSDDWDLETLANAPLPGGSGH